jgi:hypothetical protein
LGGKDDAQAQQLGYSMLHGKSNRPASDSAGIFFNLAAGSAGKSAGSKSWTAGAVISSEEPMLFQVSGRNGSQKKKMERRHSLRIAVPFPVRIRGVSAAGKRLEFETQLENLGAGGLFVKAAHDISSWKNLTLIMRLSLAESMETQAPVVAARARILRMENRGDGRNGFAIAFTRHRFV